MAVALATGLGSLAAELGAENLPDPGDSSLPALDRVTALIERMRIEQRSYTNLRATFEQRTESELLLEPEVARGAFYYRAPDTVRWEYFEPTPKIIFLDDGNMTTWYQDLGRAETLRVGRHSDRVLKYLGAGGSLETLMEYFTLRVTWPEETAGGNGPYRLTLLPRYERIAKRLEVIKIEVDSQNFFPTRLYYLEPSGDETEYIFTDIEVNGSISEDRFRLDLPPEVTVRKRHRP